MIQRFWVAVCAVLLVISLWGAGQPRAWAASTASYTASQLEQIQRYLPGVTALRDRMAALAPLIEQENWTDVRSFIHGPLGELRRRMNYLSDRLNAADRAKAKERARAVFKHLVELDVSAANASYARTIKQYQDALVDFDAFLTLVPD